jgi:diaminopimelate epimerase
MSDFSFYKMSGAGNDFVLFDLKENKNLSLDEERVRKICDRRNGIGSDGIILIDDIPDADFNMTYYNADGSKGSLCGNGARCAIKFADFSGRLNDADAEFLCDEVRYSGLKLDDEKIKFYLQNPTNKIESILLEAGNYNMNVWFIDTGSPHVVINVDDIESAHISDNDSKSLEELPVLVLGSEIRHHDQFAPDGTNVNFIQLNGDSVLIRTYERGVENETLACGTGSVASAIFVNENYNISAPVKLITRGNDELIVDFNKNGLSVENVSLTGPAKIIYNGKISISNL